MSTKYYPGNFLVYLFSHLGAKVETASGFDSYQDACAWRDENRPKGGSGVVLRIINNDLIDPSKDAWAWEGELPEEGE